MTALRIALAIAYAALGSYGADRIVSGSRRMLAGGRETPGWLGRLVAVAIVLGVMLALGRDRLLTLAVVVALLLAVPLGTRGRPLDFVDAHRREWYASGLPRRSNASPRDTTWAQVRVMAWFFALAGVLSVPALLLEG